MHNKKKLLIYTTFPYWPRLETELEIADLHLNQGYDVTLLACMGELVICPENQKHLKLKCMSCTSRLRSGYKWLGSNSATLIKLYNVSSEQRRIIDKMMLTTIGCWEDLRSIQIDGDDVGEATFNELVSHFRNTQPNFNQKNIGIAELLLETALVTHFSILNHLKEIKPDKLILFNGRIAAYRPALRVGVSLGIDTKVFEVHASNFDRYVFLDNIYTNDPAIGKDILSAYEQSKYTEEEKNRIASDWYMDRETGSIKRQLLYAHKQARGYISNDLKKYDPRLKVGFFISSEDEFVAENRSPFYKDQNEAIARISEDLKNEKILLIVRGHPNLMGLNNAQVKGLREVCSNRSNVKYIPPESKVSTYELMKLCDVVLVFVSTSGIEAVHKGKPCIVMGPAVYKGFGGTIEPNSHEQLIKLLKESAECGHIPDQYMPTEQAMRRAATIYAFGLLESGIKLLYQKPTTFFKTSWIEKNGVRSYIRPHLFFRASDFILRCVGIPGRLVKRLYNRSYIFMDKYNRAN